jgi:hypothetical protein
MKESHMSVADLVALQNGTLEPSRMPHVLDHVARCNECRSEAQRLLPLAGATRALTRELLFGAHLDEQTIATLATARGPQGRSAQIDEHLETCARCRADVNDLADANATLYPVETGSQRRGTAGMASAVAASLAVIAFASWWYVAQTAQRPAPRTSVSRPVAVAEWQSAVDTAIKRGRIDAPRQWQDIQIGQVRLRGSSAAAAPERRLSPYRELVADVRPRFRWTRHGDETFVVSVFEGNALVASSGALRRSEWTSTKDLTPGHWYVWQLEIIEGGHRTIVPAPTDAVARFAILDAEARGRYEQELSAAGADHLARGVLAARAGLKSQAEEELAAVPPASPRYGAAQTLLRSVQSWSGESSTK